VSVTSWLSVAAISHLGVLLDYNVSMDTLCFAASRAVLGIYCHESFTDFDGCPGGRFF